MDSVIRFVSKEEKRAFRYKKRCKCRKGYKKFSEEWLNDLRETLPERVILEPVEPFSARALKRNLVKNGYIVCFAEPTYGHCCHFRIDAVRQDFYEKNKNSKDLLHFRKKDWLCIDL